MSKEKNKQVYQQKEQYLVNVHMEGHLEITRGLVERFWYWNFRSGGVVSLAAVIRIVMQQSSPRPLHSFPFVTENQ